jgi:hypothetical protein
MMPNYFMGLINIFYGSEGDQIKTSLPILLHLVYYAVSLQLVIWPRGGPGRKHCCCVYALPWKRDPLYSNGSLMEPL